MGGTVSDPQRHAIWLVIAMSYEDHITDEGKLDRLAKAEEPFAFTNGWLARWAQDAADRLTR